MNSIFTFNVSVLAFDQIDVEKNLWSRRAQPRMLSGHFHAKNGAPFQGTIIHSYIEHINGND